MGDLLRIDHINSLPQPFMATFWGGDEWPVLLIDVQTGLMTIDVVGKSQNMHIDDVKHFTDIDGTDHDVATFYCDYAHDSLISRPEE